MIKKIMLRKKILVDKKFQLSFVGYTIIPVILIDLCFWLAIEYHFNNLAHQALQVGLQRGHQFFSLLHFQKTQFISLLFIVSLLIAAIMLVWGIYISHRLAGPLVKFNESLKNYQSIEEAREKPVLFRQKDFFYEISKSFNEFIGRLK